MNKDTFNLGFVCNINTTNLHAKSSSFSMIMLVICKCIRHQRHLCLSIGPVRVMLISSSTHSSHISSNIYLRNFISFYNSQSFLCTFLFAVSLMRALLKAMFDCQFMIKWPNWHYLMLVRKYYIKSKLMRFLQY